MTDNNFSKILSLLNQNNNVHCRLQKRPEKYMFGCSNYGEIPNTWHI